MWSPCVTEKMPSLDRSRSFGRIIPPLDNGAAFEQDGRLFSVDGAPVPAGEEESAPEPEAKPRVRPGPKPKARPEAPAGEVPADAAAADLSAGSSSDAPAAGIVPPPEAPTLTGLAIGPAESLPADLLTDAGAPPA